jgi:hypothetical protein
MLTIVRTERFLEEFSEIEPDPKLQEFFIRRIEWPLSREPGIGFRTERAGIYGLCVRHKRSEVVVYYSFNAVQLFLESVRLDEYDAE